MDWLLRPFTLVSAPSGTPETVGVERRRVANWVEPARRHYRRSSHRVRATHGIPQVGAATHPPETSAGIGLANRTGNIALLATVLSLDITAGGGITAADPATLVSVHHTVTVAIFLRIVGIAPPGFGFVFSARIAAQAGPVVEYEPSV